jgi:hypothetical protein
MPAKPIPVAGMSSDAPSRTRRRLMRCRGRTTAGVSAALQGDGLVLLHEYPRQPSDKVAFLSGGDCFREPNGSFPARFGDSFSQAL